MRIAVALFFGASTNGIAQPAEPVREEIGQARASLQGSWGGKLEYLDYSADKWFGIPVKTVVEDQGDGATIIRRSDFDDGPKVGNVRITTVELHDAVKGTIAVGTFRKGREPEISIYAARLEGKAPDAAHVRASLPFRRRG